MSLRSRDNVQAKCTELVLCSDSCTHVGPPLATSNPLNMRHLAGLQYINIIFFNLCTQHLQVSELDRAYKVTMADLSLVWWNNSCLCGAAQWTLIMNGSLTVDNSLNYYSFRNIQELFHDPWIHTETKNIVDNKKIYTESDPEYDNASLYIGTHFGG